ncbi:MAG TPA: hypothetical protein VGZ48_13970 [Candidatus Acidoferrales bacterium]|nr:hypothetical protein [Candidatus Acidoferrales bacterium]
MRIRVLCLIALMACGAAAILSQGAAVPISEEHHHHLIIENSYVKAYEVEVPPHEPTLLHQHDYDYVYIVFGDADITNAVTGKPPVSSHLPDTTVNFAKGPFAHVAVNTGNTPFRNATISLLHKQGEVKIYYPSVQEALDSGAKERQAKGGNSSDSLEVTLIETADMRVKAIQVGSGVGWTAANSRGPFLIINLDKVKMFDKPGPMEKNASSFPADLLRWYGADTRAYFVGFEGVGPRLVELEFKN